MDKFTEEEQKLMRDTGTRFPEEALIHQLVEKLQAKAPGFPQFQQDLERVKDLAADLLIRAYNTGHKNGLIKGHKERAAMFPQTTLN